MYISGVNELGEVIDIMSDDRYNNGYQNDMTLLSKCHFIKSFKTSPHVMGIVDPACLGQCFLGIDPSNNPGNTIGFVNETSTFKPDYDMFHVIDGKVFYNNCKILTLHVHSKKLKELKKKLNCQL